MALRECRVTFRDVRDIQHSVTVHAETTMDADALGLKRVREQRFVMEDLADPVTVRTGHVDPAQGVAQEGDRLDGARGRQESQGNRDEGASAGGLIGLRAKIGRPHAVTMRKVEDWLHPSRRIQRSTTARRAIRGEGLSPSALKDFPKAADGNVWTGGLMNAIRRTWQ